MAYKRKRVYAPRASGMKRRKGVLRKRRYKRRYNTNSTTSRTNDLRTVNKRSGRKLSKRAWRRMLYTQTQILTKYKSAQSLGFQVITPTNITSQRVATIPALVSTAGQEFYRTGGGLQDANFGVTSDLGPRLSGVIVRGGVLMLQAGLRGNSGDAVSVTVELRWCKQQFRNTTDTGGSNTTNDWLTTILSGTQALTWQLDDAPDAQEYVYPPVLRKSMELRPGDSFNLNYKLKPTKVDTGEFERGMGLNPVWIMYVHQINDQQSVAEVVDFVYGHDLSFVPMSDAT